LEISVKINNDRKIKEKMIEICIPKGMDKILVEVLQRNTPVSTTIGYATI